MTTVTDAVAQSVLHACKRADADVALTYVACDEAGHTVRLSSGSGASVTALLRGLRAAMPLSAVKTYESALDGSLQAQIVVPSAREEMLRARELATERRSLKMLMRLASLLCIVGVTLWAVQLAEPAPLPAFEPQPDVLFEVAQVAALSE